MRDRFDHKLEHTLNRKRDGGSVEDAVTSVRRIEMITGTARRRRWSDDEKARIVVESLKPGANVSEIARRHGVSPQQLFGWRRLARTVSTERTTSAEQPAGAPRSTSGMFKHETVPAFAPVVLAVSPQLAAADAGAPPPTRAGTNGCIEIIVGDAVVRVIGQVESTLLITVLRAVRRAS